MFVGRAALKHSAKTRYDLACSTYVYAALLQAGFYAKQASKNFEVTHSSMQCLEFANEIFLFQKLVRASVKLLSVNWLRPGRLFVGDSWRC